MNMKRRNADCGKLRRPLKRSKITEGIYGSAFLYLKFLMVWALVLMADFILEFRFEYLWPFWLLLRSVYDSFKYQGLAFSVFFVCIAVTSDVVCYLFIPVQWLFFAASTYVWVQYVWHTDRGICLPTVSLWLLFVYIEASVRLRELRPPSPLSFQLNLCRPFAAHCIGYPVVTLGFGFKSYVSYKMRLRKQKDVQRENDFYFNVLQQALPPDQQQINIEKHKSLTNNTDIALNSSKEEEISSNGVPSTKKANSKSDSSTSESSQTKDITSTSSRKHNTNNIEDFEYIEKTLPKKHNVNENEEIFESPDITQQHSNKSFTKSTSKSTSKLNSSRDTARNKDKVSSSSRGKDNTPPTTTTNNLTATKEDIIARLESDIKRVKLDLQVSRNIEQDLRSQINNLTIGDKSQKTELHQLRQDNESLQTKLHNLVTSRQQDKMNLAEFNRKLVDERKARAVLEVQLATERKVKKQEEAAAARAVAMAAAQRGECTLNCKQRRKELENDVKQMKLNTNCKDEQIHRLERDVQSLVQYKEAQSETDILMSALAAMQDKNAHLEHSLSAETRLKLDLFSALGDAKRQIEIQQEMLIGKENELTELKAKIAEVMALMPTSTYPSTTTHSAPLHYTHNFIPKRHMVNGDMGASGSSLNPNACDYTPKTN